LGAGAGFGKMAGLLNKGIKEEEKKIEEQKSKDISGFMRTEKGDDAIVEAVISEWKISNKGQLTKVKEISFEYKSTFKPTTNG